MRTVVLLLCSNVFMIFAWYGHLKSHQNDALWKVILASWAIAFFEYSLMIPANRYGIQEFSLPQLKVIQEVIHLALFAVFAAFFMRVRLTPDHGLAALCLIGAVFFTFRGG